MSWLNIERRVYVVTGGSSGIGDAIVKELIADGASVVNADVHEGSFPHENLEFVPTDVTDPASVEQLAQTAIDQFGHIDGVVNNAGINLPGYLLTRKIQRANTNCRFQTFRNYSLSTCKAYSL